MVGALLLLALIVLLWLWIAPKQQAPTDTGSFGSAEDRSGGTSGSSGPATNLGSSLGDTSGGSGSGGSRGGDSSGGVGGSAGDDSLVSGGGEGSDNAIVGSATRNAPRGVTWLTNPAGSTLVGSGRVFTGSEINQLTGANGSLPNLAGGSGIGSGGIGLGTALLGAGVTGALTCGAQALFATGALATGQAAAGGVTAGAIGAPGIASADYGARALLGFIASNQAAQTGTKVAQEERSFASCILNTIAKVALQQMTASIVNWINSGFNGKPGFVQNYNQFFTNVADQAAGEFIKGSGLAFLCSPFRPQVRVAIAKAYANRGAQSCSLTSIIRNTTSFMNGNFSSGGWPGFLAFTTMPTNNPYGAYADAQIRLGNYQADKLLEQSNRLKDSGGFLSVVKQQECVPTKIPGTETGLSYTCKDVVVTPGRVVADSISKTLGQGQDQLGLANSFDQIISALVTQLMTRALYNGLAGNNTIGVDPAQQALYAQAQALLNEMQATVNTAQQYGSVKQGSINDMQQVQRTFNTVYNCWNTKTPQTNQTREGAALAQAQIDTLQPLIDLTNNAITRANASIAAIQDLQTELALATNAAGVQAVANSFNTAKANGTFLTQQDVSTAIQDRQTLQSEMARLTTQANAQLAQCNSV